MLLRNLEGADSRRMVWEDLTAGLPTIVALAQICSDALVAGECDSVQPLNLESQAILFAATQRGVIEIRNAHRAFDSVQRFLAVYVEIEPERFLAFKDPDQPEQTIRFMEGFRRLCQQGLVMHQTQREFSLTAAGFDRAKSLQQSEFQSELNFAVETDNKD
jgi:hypothetical protein